MDARRMLARVIAALAVALALVTAAAATALADEEFLDSEYGVRYALHDDGTATVIWDASQWVSVPGAAVTILEKVKGHTVTAVGNEAFLNFDSLASIKLPAGVTRIGGSAFADCDSLSSVTFAEGSLLQTIDTCAFCECDSLEAIDIPASVREIGGGAFSGTGLKAAALPEGLTSVAGGLFSGCDSLAEVSIPSTVESVGSFAFNGCGSLSTVRFGGSPLQWAAMEWDIGDSIPDPSTYGKFDVTFDAHGGSAVAFQAVEPGGTATKPEDPTKDGRSFDRWYADGGLTTPFDFATTIDGDRTLHAGWLVRMAVGTHNRSNPANPGCGSVDIEASVPDLSHAGARAMNYTEPEGEGLTLTARPDEGYAFVGWYEGAVGPSHFVEGPTGDPISGSLTLTGAAEDLARVCAVFECAGHRWEQRVEKATPAADGRVYRACAVCGAEEDVAPLPKVGSIKLARTSFTYTGRALEPAVTVANASEALSPDCYTITYANNVNAGTATAKVTLRGSYHEGSKALKFTITKAANTLSAKAKSKGAVAVRAGKGLAAKKLLKISGAKGAVTYVKAKGIKKITVAKNGKVTVMKDCRKGTYTLTVKVKAAGDANHKAATKTVKVKVKVK